MFVLVRSRLEQPRACHMHAHSLLIGGTRHVPTYDVTIRVCDWVCHSRAGGGVLTGQGLREARVVFGRIETQCKFAECCECGRSGSTLDVSCRSRLCVLPACITTTSQTPAPHNPPQLRLLCSVLLTHLFSGVVNFRIWFCPFVT